jgi:alkyl sulfatase BDS1-like metallo-beta-lactamase superfamily hydrolase
MEDNMAKSADSWREPKEASEATRRANAAVADRLPFHDRQDFADAGRGLIATAPPTAIGTANGRAAWDLGTYAFAGNDACPATVNPSLWRKAQLNLSNGLFEVTQRVYQLRGFDISNMTIIEGNHGLIVIDPLFCMETAAAALELYYAHRLRKPVVAVIYSHSHRDHYGGVKGVVTLEQVRGRQVEIIAPEGFLDAVVGESILAGNAMRRRGMYMFGTLLAPGERGMVDGGLGKATSRGTVGLIAPTTTIRRTGEQRTIDGVEIEFQMAPETEAPAEMLMYFPQFRTLCAAEDATHNLHNLYTPRGAVVRDARAWWKSLNEALDLFGNRSDVLIAQHHWPTWGGDNVRQFLSEQRDLYKYIHDQSLRLANHGYTMVEIAEMLELPPGLAARWHARDYYGTLNHNAKAVYQRYLGWYDSNPANLYPLPPEQAAHKYIEFMGGVDAVVGKARRAFDRGEYRWVAEVMKHALFAAPEHHQARSLAADALEQLGYQAESAVWRNEFLTAARELRNGVPPTANVMAADMIEAMNLPMFLDYMGVRLNGDKAGGRTLSFNLALADTGEECAVTLRNAALTYSANRRIPDADADIRIERAALAQILFGGLTLDGAIASDQARVEGAGERFVELLAMLDEFDPMFNIVTP